MYPNESLNLRGVFHITDIIFITRITGSDSFA
jgi:hypothetical protein